jgi:UDP-N-acetylmuramate--alanine ligase
VNSANAQFDLSTKKRIHVVGVGGPGMSAIAQVLVEMGHEVSGSDIKDSETVQRLREIGVVINVGHDAASVHQCDAVTASSAIPKQNIELVEAINTNIAVLSRAQMLALICGQKLSIGVAGTHGKTTTSSMLMTVLRAAQLHPSFIIGGEVRGVGSGASWDSGDHLVVEADESDGTHEQIPLGAVIVTNVDVDHLDHFSTFDNLVESFGRFIDGVSGPKVICVDDASLSAIALQQNVTTYAIHAPAQFTARNVQFHDGGSTFDVLHDEASGGSGLLLGRVAVQLRGEHNVANALGVIAMSTLLGIEFAVIASSLAAFSGVSRRFDQRGNDEGVSFVDDYAHLPTEISAVLSSCTDETDSWTRVVAVFQPNRFNRMQHMSDAYADCFTAADHVVITDIYSSGTTPIAGVTGKLVVDAIARAHPDTSIAWKPTRAELIQHLATELRSGDLCISMGCGDIETLPDEVIAARRTLRGGS